MEGITDDHMRRMLQTTRRYTLVILHRTLKREGSGADRIVWEHGRRNFELRKEGKLCVVGPVVKDESDIAGMYIFSTDLESTRKIVDEDPAVEAGIFTYDAHVIESFPGDGLS